MGQHYQQFYFFFFFFNDTATTEIYTLSLHDALPILHRRRWASRTRWQPSAAVSAPLRSRRMLGDRKSTRLNSSHVKISYAVFCLKKKTKNAEALLTCQKKRNNK